MKFRFFLKTPFAIKMKMIYWKLVYPKRLLEFVRDQRDKEGELLLIITENGFPRSVRNEVKNCERIDELIYDQAKLKDIVEGKYTVILEYTCRILHYTSILLDAGISRNRITYLETPRIDVNSPLLSYDVTLGYVREQSGQKYTGFWTFGNEENASLRILILGNSTSYVKFGNMLSWPEALYENLKEKNVFLMCGGMISFNSFQELLKLIRDGLYLKPDIVISLSGVCNVRTNYERKLIPENPYVWKYQTKLLSASIRNGLRNELAGNRHRIKEVSTGLQHCDFSYEEWWINTMRQMHAICSEYGICFLGYLQPNLYVGNYCATGKEKGKKDETYINGVRKWYENVKVMVSEYPYIKDITGIFDGETDIYWDTCHVYERGNRRIAERISKDIVSIIEEEPLMTKIM